MQRKEPTREYGTATAEVPWLPIIGGGAIGSWLSDLLPGSGDESEIGLLVIIGGILLAALLFVL